MNKKDKIVILGSKLALLNIMKDDREFKKNSNEISILLQEIENLNSDYESDSWYKFLKFSQEELNKMTGKFKNAFKTNDCIARVRKRISEELNFIYEITFTSPDYDILVSDTDLSKAKEKFIDAVNKL